MTDLATDSPENARQHARAQGGIRVEAMPLLPPSAAHFWPDGVAQGDRLWAETIDGGNYTSFAVARGTVIELTDLQGDGCAHLALFNALETDERLNVADTIKVQWQAYLGPGQLLLSDRGRALATITSDLSRHHDTLAGTSTLVSNTRKYGDGLAHSNSPAGRELLILAAAKVGLTPRDIPPTLSFFKRVIAETDGSLSWKGAAKAGASIRLRAELPLLVVIANVPHPLDPRPDYVSTPVRVRAWRQEPANAESPEAVATPEAQRAFANTIAYANLRGV